MNPCEIVCLGDFNHDQLKPNNSNWKELEKTMGIFNLQQIITKPTRITPTSVSCLDHIWTNQPHMYTNRDVASCTLSDHSLVYTSRKASRPKREPRIIEARSYRQFDQDAFVTDLAGTNWDSVHQAESPDQAWSNFLGLFLPVCDKHAPIKKNKSVRSTT